MHYPNDHWVTIFEESPSTNVFKIFDSVFDSPNNAVYTVASNLFNVGDDHTAVMV